MARAADGGARQRRLRGRVPGHPSRPAPVHGARVDRPLRIVEPRSRQAARRGPGRHDRPRDRQASRAGRCGTGRRRGSGGARGCARGARPGGARSAAGRPDAPRRRARVRGRAAGSAHRCRRSRAGALLDLVRAVPSLVQRRGGPPRDLRRRRGAPALRRVDGVRRPVPAADPSDRPRVPQGAEQRAGRPGTAMSAARGRSEAPREATRRSIPSSARSRTSTGWSSGRRRTASRSRSTSRSSARPTTPG